MKKEWFEDWFNSPYHTMLYPRRDKNEATDFIKNLVNYLNPAPESKILDAACGEGRHAIQLAKYGFNVTGIDLAKNRIRTARQFETDRLRFFVRDMRLPLHENYFDYVFNFFTSFGYFADREDNHLAASAFAKTLKPGGILLVDYFNAEKVVADLVPKEQFVRNDLPVTIYRKIKHNKIIKTILIKNNDEPHLYREKVSTFSQTDLIELFAQHGMKHLVTFGNYRLDCYDKQHSPRLILLLQKS